MTQTREGHLWLPSTSIKHGLTTDAVVSSTPIASLKSSYDVIVIGSGFAGLIAARDIALDQNVSVLLIEGRDRIGGRTWTSKELGEEFEMGGTWVHWNQPHIYAELSRYNLHKNLKTSAGTLAAEKTFFKSATAATTQEVRGEDINAATQRVADAFFAIDGKSSREWMPYPHDPLRLPAPWKLLDHLTVKDRLEQIAAPQWEKDVFDAMVSSFGSAPGSQIGLVEVLRWYALSGHSMAGVFEAAGVYKLGKGGMTSLARAILADYGGHVVMDTVVNSISQDARTVTVTTTAGRVFLAEHVICTIPLNCLSDVSFSPPLSPPKQLAIGHGHINQGAKIHFKLRQTEPGWFAMASGYGDSPWCFAFSDHNGTNVPSLSSSSAEPATGNGTYCISFGYNGHLSSPNDSSHIVSSFRQYIKPNADVAAYLTHDWHNDPLAKGVWSCWGPGAMGKYLEELQKPHGRVLFASADWADGWRGFIDGAIERGARAAGEIMSLSKNENTAERAKL